MKKNPNLGSAWFCWKYGRPVFLVFSNMDTFVTPPPPCQSLLKHPGALFNTLRLPTNPVEHGVPPKLGVASAVR